MQNEPPNFRTIAQHEEAIAKATECIGHIRKDMRWTITKTVAFLFSLGCSLVVHKVEPNPSFWDYLFLVTNILGSAYFLIQGFLMLNIERKWKIVAQRARRLIQEAQDRPQRIAIWKQVAEASVRYEEAEAAGDERKAWAEYEEINRLFDEIKPLM